MTDDKTSLVSYIVNSAGAAIGLLTLQEWAVLASILFGAGTFAVTVWRNGKLVEIKEREAKASIEADNAKREAHTRRHDD